MAAQSAIDGYRRQRLRVDPLHVPAALSSPRIAPQLAQDSIGRELCQTLFHGLAQPLRDGRPDGHSCLLLDMHMPGLSGVELLERVRGDHPLMPVVVMTSRPGAAIAKAAASAGAPLLEKPFRGRELLDAIEGSLRGQP